MIQSLLPVPVLLISVNTSRFFRNVIVLSEKKGVNCAGEPRHRRHNFSGVDAAREPPDNHYC